MNSRIILTVAATGLVCAHALAAPPATPPAKPVAAAGPWAKVPALTTACYSGQDPWSDKLNAALAAIQQDHNRQNDINGEIQQRATDTFSADPFAAAQRMQQAMMDDPQNAQKIMEQMMQQGEQDRDEAPARHAKEQQIEAESETVMKQYKAALAKAMEPGHALKKKYGLPDAARDSRDCYDWNTQECHAILTEYDKGYVATCAQWWSATGPIHAYMKRYKDFLVLERIPFEKKGDEAKLHHYRQLQVPTTGWRTTTDYDAAEDYMNMASTLFGERETGRWCRHETFCK